MKNLVNRRHRWAELSQTNWQNHLSHGPYCVREVVASTLNRASWRVRSQTCSWGRLETHSLVSLAFVLLLKPSCSRSAVGTCRGMTTGNARRHPLPSSVIATCSWENSMKASALSFSSALRASCRVCECDDASAPNTCSRNDLSVQGESSGQNSQNQASQYRSTGLGSASALIRPHLTPHRLSKCLYSENGQAKPWFRQSLFLRTHVAQMPLRTIRSAASRPGCRDAMCAGKIIKDIGQPCIRDVSFIAETTVPLQRRNKCLLCAIGGHCCRC